MAEHRLNNIGRLVWRGLKKKPLQNICVLLCFALIGALLFSALSLMGGTVESLETGISRMGADLLVVPEEDVHEGEAIILRGEPSTFFFTNINISDLEDIQGVDTVSPQIYIASLSASCCSLPVQLIGFDPDHDFTITPWLESGLQRPLGKDEVIVGGGISGEPGSELMFYGHNFTIAGRLEVTGMGLDTSVFMRIDDAFTMAEESGLKAVQKLDIRPGQVSSFLVRVDDHADPNEVGNLIQAQISGTRVITPHQHVATVNSHLSQILKTLYLIAVILILISLPLAGTIAFLSARERQRDMGFVAQTCKLRQLWLSPAQAQPFQGWSRFHPLPRVARRRLVHSR
jgi:putative ABC transport system permease protein